MIERFDIHFVHASHDENLQKYVTKKLGKLDRYLPKSAHSSARLTVTLKEGKAKDGRDCTCEVSLHLQHETINVAETSLNMYTAVDIVELKLKQSVRKYKEQHSGAFRRRLASRFNRKSVAVQPDLY